MSIQKQCAVHLRAFVQEATGNKLGSSHAHEIVAAFYGYATAAALQTDVTCPVDKLADASILIPKLEMIDRRLRHLEGSLPPNMPSAEVIAEGISDLLIESSLFDGEIWLTRDIGQYIIEDVIQKNPYMIEKDLAGAMAETNAYDFDLEDLEAEVQVDPGFMTATITGACNGVSDPDKPFSGDSIAFTTTMSFTQVASRVGYSEPDIETSGDVDMKDYYD